MRSLLFALSLVVLGVFVSCSRDDGNSREVSTIPSTTIEGYSIAPIEVTMKYNQKQKFVIKNDKTGVLDSSFSWKISDEKRGTIDANGLLTAEKIGTFYVIATKNGKTVTSKVDVTPCETFFKEPSMIWGATKKLIKSSETRELAKETSTTLVYKGENKFVNHVEYKFDNKGIMLSATATFPTDPNSIYRVTTFFLERYEVFYYDQHMIYMKYLYEPIYLTSSIDSALGLYITYEYKKPKL
ncbi:Ig-like domain-containing protein [Riemerella anatipestifer]|uniref:Ig-like domain-containing protein n=1 Tax=Riemerella anatipestifer TaxID=34085 RepID=UPI0030BD9E17